MINISNYILPLFITLIIISLLLLIIFIYMKIASERKPSNRNVELMNVRSEVYEFTQ